MGLELTTQRRVVGLSFPMRLYFCWLPQKRFEINEMVRATALKPNAPADRSVPHATL
jgi:hypothetical protein